MKVLTIFFREEILSMLDKLIESCHLCGSSTNEILSVAEILKRELEKYSERQ